jgi:hypothetical protein
MKTTAPSTPTPTATLSPTFTAELLAAGKALGDVATPGGPFAPFVIIPDNYKLDPVPFAPDTPLPGFIDQTVTLHDPESFVAYVKRYKTLKTLIFATLPKTASGSDAQFRAVFDYHTGGKGDDQKPERCAHHAIFPCPLSIQWATWIGITGKPQTQLAFIEFIDANKADIVTPDSATLLELAINFESRTEVNFGSKVDRVHGGRKLTFNEEINGINKAGEPITVPDTLKLSLPVFEGGKAFEIAARLEWRPTGGKLHVSVHLHRPFDLVRKALADLRAEIAAGTEIEPMTGRLGL